VHKKLIDPKARVGAPVVIEQKVAHWRVEADGLARVIADVDKRVQAAEHILHIDFGTSEQSGQRLRRHWRKHHGDGSQHGPQQAEVLVPVVPVKTVAEQAAKSIEVEDVELQLQVGIGARRSVP
jgi:hypothetical protein